MDTALPFPVSPQRGSWRRLLLLLLFPPISLPPQRQTQCLSSAQSDLSPAQPGERRNEAKGAPRNSRPARLASLKHMQINPLPDWPLPDTPFEKVALHWLTDKVNANYRILLCPPPFFGSV